MNLTQELQNLQHKLRANHSEDSKAVMDQATENLD